MVRTFTAMTFVCLACSGATFDAASVRPSSALVGRDGTITINPKRLTARNATLKTLIFEAWQTPYSQITGGPAWINRDEYDIDATVESAATPAQLRLMLRGLLVERFKLGIRSETKERQVYALVVDKDGPRLQAQDDRKNPKLWRFHGDLGKFASVLAVQLTIPLLDDPTVPSRAGGEAIPVVDNTGIEGDFDIGLDIKPDAGADPFTIWQRALREQLGLRLESRKAAVEYLIVDQATKIPTAN